MSEEEEPEADLGPGPSRLSPEGWVVVGTAVVILYRLWCASYNLNPPSLWLDDAWVTVLTKYSLGEMVTYGHVSPPGLNLLVGLSYSIIPDVEIGAQLFPFLAGILAIPATAWAAYCLTEHPACAVFAAAVYASDPFVLEYSARVKPYGMDALISALLLVAFHRLLVDGYSRRRLWMVAAIAAIAAWFSFLSIFVAAILIPVAGITLLRRGVRDKQLFAAGAVAAGSVLLMYGVILRHNLPDSTFEYWKAGFLPTDSLSAFLAGCFRHAQHWCNRLLGSLAGRPRPIPGAGWVSAVLLSLGTIHLWVNGRRAHIAGGLALMAFLAIASTKTLIPLGTGRVECFLAPLMACWLCCGVAYLARINAQRWGRIVPASALVFLAIQLPFTQKEWYPEIRASEEIAKMLEVYEPGDGLICNAIGSFVLVLYTPWPASLVPEPYLAMRTRPVPKIENFGVADYGGVAKVMAARPKRVFVFGNHHNNAYRREPVLAIMRHGYRIVKAVDRPGCLLVTLERVSRSPSRSRAD